MGNEMELSTVDVGISSPVADQAVRRLEEIVHAYA